MSNNWKEAIVHAEQAQVPTRGESNFGLPSLNLEEMQGTSVPNEWDIDRVLGDVIMIQPIDENEHGEIMRNGIWMKQEVTQKLWRVAKVLKVGPSTTGNIKVDDLVMYPSDRGLPMTAVGRKKYIFINEQRLFAIVKPKEKDVND